MSEQSESIAKLAEALSKAQGQMDCHAEASLLKKLMPSSLRAGMQHAKTPPIQRLMERVRFGMTDCWHWCGPRTPQGYGQLSYRGKGKRAHRFSYEIFKGPIPQGMMLLHSCDNPSCVNPNHLTPGTSADNRRDCIRKGRWTMRRKVINFDHHSNSVSPGMLDRMRDLRRHGLSYASIGESIGTDAMKVWHALNRRFKNVH